MTTYYPPYPSWITQLIGGAGHGLWGQAQQQLNAAQAQMTAAGLEMQRRMANADYQMQLANLQAQMSAPQAPRNLQELQPGASYVTSYGGWGGNGGWGIQNCAPHEDPPIEPVPLPDALESALMRGWEQMESTYQAYCEGKR